LKSIYSSSQAFIVYTLRISNKEAKKLFDDQQVYVNDVIAYNKQPIHRTDTIRVRDFVIKESEKLIYIAYYKPRGVECTLNSNIPNNLYSALQLEEHLFPIGRLDKESEGLLLLTNDGSIYNQIVHSDQYKEKEYIVEVDQVITQELIFNLGNGVQILGQTTRPCSVWQVSERTFRIILTQGLNRQIRRMCYKLGYKVVTLKRTRILNVLLGDLKPGEIKHLEKTDLI
jgi:23S rRNA pseudouridine2604 synthase